MRFGGTVGGRDISQLHVAPATTGVPVDRKALLDQFLIPIFDKDVVWLNTTNACNSDVLNYSEY